MLCAACNATLAAGVRFCTSCGAPVAARCPRCDAEVSAADRFCGACGAGVAAEPAASAPAARAFGEGEGERRQVTVLFADMEGYTTLAEKLGEEGTYTLMQPVLQRMVETIHAHGGTTQDLAGDGVMALFGAPQALEDAPLRACQAALDLHQRLADLGEGIRARHGVTPRFRVGLNAGPVVLGQMGDGERIEFRAVGDTVNLAARLQGLAEPGSVLLSEDVHRLVEGYVDDADLGARSVKGKAEPVHVFRLDAVRGGVNRFQRALQRGLTSLVGREAELERMESAWMATRAGACRALCLSGEAGLGKSRLLHEFCERRAREQAFVLRAHCAPGGRSTPFLPLAELVRTSFRISADQGKDAVAARLKRGLEVLGADSAQNVDYLLNLLGFAVGGEAFSKENAEVVGIRTRDLLLLLIEERCRASEVVLVIEDLQWIDRASEALLARLLDEGKRLMVICSYRPPYAPPWADAANAEVVRLAPLSAANTEALLRARLGSDALPRALTQLVLDKAEGNPLFAEEIAQLLAERGAIRQGAGGLEFDASAARALPASLENMLLERVEQLDESARGLLQAAAVVGRRFSLEVATRAARLNGAGASSAARLQALELIVPDTEPGVFRFNSALLQEAIYQSLLSARREALHGSVAVALEESYGERAPEIADLLANHYVATPRAEKAVVYMRLAGEKALRMYSLDEAELRFRQVIELIEKVPGCANDVFLVDTLLNVSRVLYYKAAFNELITLIERQLPLAERLGDRARLGRFLFELGYAHCFNANPETGKPLLERALALAEADGDERLVAYVLMGLLWEHTYWEPPTPETRAAHRTMAERAEAIGRRLHDHWVTVKVIAALAIDALLFGRPAQTRREALRLIEYSRETGDPRGRSMGHYCLAWADGFSFDFASAIDNADESIRIGLSPIDRLTAQAAKAWAQVLAEQAEAALPTLEALTASLEHDGFGQMRYTTDIALGVAQVATGGWTQGVRTLEQRLASVEARGARQLCAIGHYTLGEVYARMALREGKAGWQEISHNLGFTLTALPRATARARRHLA
ncbi:MAG TPA: AAA family ATPase, partial [Burkholderiales bacterium]|nr:AAA family ATPase [Burkholderiales bacterium]